MAQENQVPSTSCKGSRQDVYWWEEDFYAGKLVDLPLLPKANTEAELPAALVHIQHPLDIAGETSEHTGTDVLTQGFRLAKVPSLVDLCMDKIISVTDSPGAIRVPPGLAPLLRRHRARLKLQKIQLTWLLKELVTREKTLHTHLRGCLRYFVAHKGTLFFRQCRPVWETDLQAHEHVFRNTYDRYGADSCAYVPVAIQGREFGDWCIAALAHTLQLMLPQQLRLETSDPSLRKPKPAGNALEEALEASIRRVSHALSKICPKLVKCCLEPALAYVWWSRGDLPKAKQIFLRISKQMQRCTRTSRADREHKMWISLTALYLNEIGRLHSYFGQPDMAVQYYGQAADLYATHVPRHAMDCYLQSLVLIAAAYDQGLMGGALAVQAADSWRTLTAQPDIEPNIVQMAAESFMHCHTGYQSTRGACTDNQTVDWLLEGKDLLTRLVTRAPQVNLHLSLVQAMLGEDMAAEDSYMNYVQHYASHHPALQQKIPGAVSVFVGSEIKPHPWWVFSKWQVTNKEGEHRLSDSQHLSPLPLLWKRPFRFSDCNTNTNEEHLCPDLRHPPHRKVTELQGSDLSLYLSEDGLLGGCLAQNLPPLRPLLLDPYTGRICVPGQYREQEILPKWDIGKISGHLGLSMHNLTFDTYIPTPVHVYSSSTGGVASFLIWNQDKVNETVHSRNPTPLTHAVLTYSSCESGTHTLNLVEPVHESRKKLILKQLSKEGYSNCPQAMHYASDFLDFCSNNCKIMQYDFLTTALDDASMERRSGKASGVFVHDGMIPPRGQLKLGHHTTCKLETETMALQRVMPIGQSTAVLALHEGGHTGHACRSRIHDVRYADTLVFVDFSSPETFSKPVIPCSSHPSAIWHLQPTDGLVGKSSNIFVAVEVSPVMPIPVQDRLVIFDAKGTVLHIHPVLKRHTAVVAPSSYPVLGNSCECMDMVLHNNETNSRLRLMSTDGTIQFRTEPLGGIEHFLLVGTMVFVALRDRILVLDSATLEPIEITHMEPQFSAAKPGLPSGKPGVLLTGERSFLKVLSVNKLFTSQSVQADECIQVILGVANHVFVLQRARHRTHCTAESPLVSVLAKIMVPGVPTEACYLSQLDGFVVTVSLFQDTKLPLYRENLYWFDINGCIRGIHPFIGPGPHCIFATELKRTPPGVKETQLASGKNERTSLASESDNMHEKQWHIFFADGLGALCCIKL